MQSQTMKHTNTSSLKINPDQSTYVRILRRTDTGFVEFLFGINSSDLMVELILPEAAFMEFCESNSPTQLTSEESIKQDADILKWQFGEAGVQE
ncbi:phenol hydroxylase subunit [Zhongshania sp. BJYM1]|uniref:phenol hydroxylase subunit n=1 Tax=Zhongshania aquatica TaxID=2965069 RepID=UPI0022B4B7FB|nr:phenol hydroxylase subunit [Marortus sp. BJYM1]